jgi:hypothetical protein
MGSSNGILVDGIRVENVTLKEGVKFYVGTTLIEVISEVELDESIDTGLPDWRIILAKYLKKLSRVSQAPNQNILPFNPPLELLIVQGKQLDTRWLLGYGPRKIGRFSRDLIILEEDAPNICFEILPVEKGALFRTTEPGRVRLNNTVIRENLLKSGDEIIIENTHIRVNFINE